MTFQVSNFRHTKKPSYIFTEGLFLHLFTLFDILFIFILQTGFNFYIFLGISLLKRIITFRFYKILIFLWFYFSLSILFFLPFFHSFLLAYFYLMYLFFHLHLSHILYLLLFGYFALDLFDHLL